MAIRRSRRSFLEKLSLGARKAQETDGPCCIRSADFFGSGCQWTPVEAKGREWAGAEVNGREWTRLAQVEALARSVSANSLKQQHCR